MHDTIGMSENLPTFIEAPSMGAKFSSLTKPLTPRWDSPRNLNRDFRLSSQKPCKVFKCQEKERYLVSFNVNILTKIMKITWSSAAGGNLQQESSRVTSMQPCQM